MFDFESPSVAGSRLPSERRDLCFSQPKAPAKMSRSHGMLVPGAAQLLRAILSKGLQQSIAHRRPFADQSGLLLRQHERPIDELEQEPKHVLGLDRLAGADLLGRAQ